MYQSRGFNPQNLFRVADDFTRPANTTAYASLDLVANSVTAASVTPLSWTLARTVTGLVKVTAGTIKKSGTTVTNAHFTLMLFDAAPTVATTGDNGVFASVVSGVDAYLGAIDIDVVKVFVDGAAGRAATVDDTTGYTDNGIILKPAAGRIIYGLLKTREAYTPASAEVFTVELECERA